MGKTDGGAEIAPNDPNWDRLQQVARRAAEDPAAWLGLEEIYGEIGRNPAAVAAFGVWLTALMQDGTAATLRRYIAG